MASPQEEFVHPVIQAMQNAYEQIQKTKSTKFNQELNTREADLRQAQFDELQKQHDQENKRAEKQLEINLQMHKQQLRQNQLLETDMIQKLINSGVNPQRGDVNIQPEPNMLPPGPNGEQAPGIQMPGINQPGMGNYKIPNTDIQLDPNAYTSPQEQIQRTLDLMKGETTAKESAAAPFRQAEQERLFGQQQRIADTTFSRELVVHANDRAAQERIAAQKDATDRYLGELNARTRLRLAQSGLDSNNPAIDNYVNDMYLTGNMDKVPGSSKVQNAIRGSVPNGWTPLSKIDAAQLDGIPMVDQLIIKTKQLATQGSGVIGRLGAATGLGESGNTAQEVDALLGNVARIFGGEKGVLTQRDVDRAKGLIYSPKQSQAKNLEKAQQLENLLNTKINQLITKYPEDQRNALLGRRGIDPGRFAKQSSGQSLADKYGY